MSDSIFSIELASQLSESAEKFPVEFDLAWEWLGYSKRNNAKTSLLAAGFEVGEDLLIDQQLGTLAVPRPEEAIHLTIDCLKSWAMMAAPSPIPQPAIAPNPSSRARLGAIAFWVGLNG